MAIDLELLALEIETMWVADERGRLLRTREFRATPAPHMVVAVAGERHVVAFGTEVPEGLVGELEAAVATSPLGPLSANGEREHWLSLCVKLLSGVVGPVEVSSGPSYVIPAGTAFGSEATIVQSNDEGAAALRKRDPARGGWSAEEWKMLIDGALGPWSMAVSDGKVVSICHCARLFEKGAEAGVWTDAAYRGRGYAAAVTAAWASLLEGSGRTLFYSTSAENVSSQRVAGRLGLRPIGWIWKLFA